MFHFFRKNTVDEKEIIEIKKKTIKHRLGVIGYGQMT